MGFAKNAKKNKLCHDCKKEIKTKNGKLVEASFLVYKNGSERYNVLKCNECFKKNPSLTEYQPCEVYSRIVGYLRPIQQWNVGKVEEYNDRKEFRVGNGKIMAAKLN